MAGRHKRFHFHFTPTSSSWLNLVERWFREQTDKALRRGSFNSVPNLTAAIEDYLAAHNNDAKPFKWTATADSILEKVRRGRVALQEGSCDVSVGHESGTVLRIPLSCRLSGPRRLRAKGQVRDLSGAFARPRRKVSRGPGSDPRKRHKILQEAINQ